MNILYTKEITGKQQKEKMTALQLSGEMWFSLIQHEVRDDGWRERATTKRSRDIRIGQRDHPLVIHLHLSSTTKEERPRPLLFAANTASRPQFLASVAIWSCTSGRSGSAVYNTFPHIKRRQ